jgi:hypothetical protein
MYSVTPSTLGSANEMICTPAASLQAQQERERERQRQRDRVRERERQRERQRQRDRVRERERERDRDRERETEREERERERERDISSEEPCGWAAGHALSLNTMPLALNSPTTWFSLLPMPAPPVSQVLRLDRVWKAASKADPAAARLDLDVCAGG